MEALPVKGECPESNVIPCLAFQILVYKITIKTCSTDLCYFMTL